MNQPARQTERDDLIARIRQVLHPLDQRHGDSALASGTWSGDVPGVRATTPAAVLMALMPSEKGLELVLTVRSRHLPRHAGQISFPGGRMDPEDTSILDTALRESAEEVGLDPVLVEPLGCLDEYRTITGYRVIPVVAALREVPRLRREPGEVAEIFSVPLSHLLRPDAIRQESARYRGRNVRFYVIPFRQYRIWGATAAMIRQLVQGLGNE